jgi:ribose transport system substrate-binding protein
MHRRLPAAAKPVSSAFAYHPPRRGVFLLLLAELMSKLLLGLLFLGLLTSCAKRESGGGSGSAGAAGATYQIAVIPKGTTHEFWKSIHAGAVKAQRELAEQGIKVNLIWKGPLREDDREQQVQVVENFIAQRVSGIVLAPLDRKALAGPVETAVRGKIPVVIVDSGIDSPAPASFVATDNREGGRIAARELGKLLGGRGNVVMLRYAVGSASTEQREEGFLEVMNREFPSIKLLSTDQHAGATRDSAKRTAENLLNRFGRDVNGVFAVNESSAAGMLLALRDAGLAGGKVKFVAFDSGETLNAGLKAGDVQGMVVQNPMKMGYLAVKTMAAVLRGEKVEPVIDTGVGFVTRENFDSPEMAEIVRPPLDQYLK